MLLLLSSPSAGVTWRGSGVRGRWGGAGVWGALGGGRGGGRAGGRWSVGAGAGRPKRAALSSPWHGLALLKRLTASFAVRGRGGGGGGGGVGVWWVGGSEGLRWQRRRLPLGYCIRIVSNRSSMRQVQTKTNNRKAFSMILYIFPLPFWLKSFLACADEAADLCVGPNGLVVAPTFTTLFHALHSLPCFNIHSSLCVWSSQPEFPYKRPEHGC